MKNEKIVTKTKNILAVVMVMIFGFSVLFLSALNASAKTVSFTPKSTVSLTPTPTPKKAVDYYLAYPGILPDHPLYSLKMIRDRIWLWLTTDPSKKAEVLLLFADKRLGASKVLVEGNKTTLGISTLEKGEKYLERAAVSLEEAVDKGKSVKDLAIKLEEAALKHEEVITLLAGSLEGEAKATVLKLLDYSKSIAIKAKGLQQ